MTTVRKKYDATNTAGLQKMQHAKDIRTTHDKRASGGVVVFYCTSAQKWTTPVVGCDKLVPMVAQRPPDIFSAFDVISPPIK